MAYLSKGTELDGSGNGRYSSKAANRNKILTIIPKTVDE